MRKKVAFLLAVCMFFVTALAGCGKEESKQVALFDGDDANFVIVRSDNADTEVKEIAATLRQDIIKKLDISVANKPDVFKHQEGQIEVNIGLTNRERSQELYEEVIAANENNGMDWIVQMEGEYIYIVGATNEALAVAAKSFYGNFCRDVASTIAEDFRFLYHFESEENNFEFCGSKDMSSYCVVTPQYNMSYLIGREVTALQSEILAATGSNVVEKMDSEKETECEIIIGNTKRDGTPECTSEDEYRIKMKGKKLYVCGGSDAATAIAVKEVARMVSEGESIDAKTDIKGSYEKTVKSYENYYSLTYGDEFDTFDSAIWSVAEGTYVNVRSTTEKITAFANTSENLYIEDGNLVLKTIDKPDTIISTELRTDESMWYKYGLLEISAKMDASTGICPAFWTLGLDASEFHGELDIFEFFGKDGRIKATPISHADGTGDAKSGVYYCGAMKSPYEESFYSLPEGETFADEYHTYGLEWDETSVRWVYDGRVFLEIDTTFDTRAKKSFSSAMQIILTVYGGNDVAGLTGLPDETTDWSKNYMKVEHLRLYQTPEQELIFMNGVQQ